MNPQQQAPSNGRLSLLGVSLKDSEFQRLARLIQSLWGLKMPPAKKSLVHGRLMKRLRLLGMASYEEYCDYLFSPEGQEAELEHLIDAVSTNKTEFFREPEAINHMATQALPEMVLEKGVGLRDRLMVWSAGCATGEEPYTLAMVLEEFAQRHPGLGFDWFILGSDISSSALATASRAVYPHSRVEDINIELRKKYLMRGKDKNKDLVRIVPELRKRVAFRKINFMEEFDLREPMDIIFCRNVIIYFERATQIEVLKRLCGQLKPGGYLYLGHTESVYGMGLPITQVIPTVYRKTG
ncbi:MAG: protein-glutamate O-methyltransferase CheR [Deltaproteobacteria bacterium]|nr:protein-glutamate O-methyltransferase CheR [Deltaproteobacteria bacterium]